MRVSKQQHEEDLRHLRRSGTLFWWHVHHDMLLELGTTSMITRRRHIRAVKYPEEHARRLRWLQRVRHPGRLPALFVRQMIQAEIDRGWDYENLRRIVRRHKAALRACHRRELPGCRCWDWRKMEMIFPKRKEQP